MSLREQVVGVIEAALAEAAGGPPPVAVSELVEVPPDPKLGDFAFPCFALAKLWRKAPPLIARELAQRISADWLAKVEAVGGYLNLTVDPGAAAQGVLPAVAHAGPRYGHSRQGEGQRVVLDFSSPNIAKPFGVHHIRTTVIGHALSRIYAALGYDVVRINYLGDWGTQFGKLIVAYRRWGQEERLQAEPIRELLRLYVRFHQEAERHPELEEEARAWFKRLEDGDPEARALWQRFREESIREFRRVYDLLGIDFDEWSGESFYNDKMESVLERLQAQGLLQESEGALVVEVGDDLPPCLLRKRDGATLYATRDLAAAIDRWERYQFHRLLYVVATQQSLHFRQVFGVLRRMGQPWVDRCVHVAFGMMNFGEGVMSTRKGHVIFLEDLLHEAVERTRRIIEQRNPNLADQERVARQVGIGAVIFGDLRHSRIKDVNFDWDSVLNFDGDTGPYVQYAHARACSVLRKASRPLAPAANVAPEALASLQAPEEKALVLLIDRFGETVAAAAQQYEPSLIARYLLDLAAAFNTFYHQHRIIGAGEPLEEGRLALTAAVRQVLANGLYLLGLGAPEEM